MTWVKLDDGFYRNAKARAAGKDGRALYLASLCWCAANGTDGTVSAGDLAILAAEADVKAKPTAARLVDVGLWEPTDDGWVVPDYLEYNPTAAKVADVRAKRAEAGRRGGQRSGQSRSKPEAITEANASAQPEQPAEQNRTPYPIPPSGSSAVVVSPPVPPADDDGIVIRVARARAARLGRINANPRWIDAVAASMRAEIGRILELDRRGHTPEQIDTALDGTHTPADTVAAASAPSVRVVEGVEMRHIPGTGWVRTA